MTVVLPPNPYVGPRSFQLGERLYGRDRELAELLDLLIAERIVLLYSPSGAGKSSLIQAGLVPLLRDEGFTILPVMRVSAEPSGLAGPGLRPATNGGGAALAEQGSYLGGGDGHDALALASNRYSLSALLALEEQLPPEQRITPAALAGFSLADYLTKHVPSSERANTVLIFDQFEEILTVDPTNIPAKVDFFTQLGQALRDRSRWALFALREDFLAGLDPYLRFVPTRFATHYRLDLLDVAGAREAMQLPAQDHGVTFTLAAAQQLADNLRRVKIQRADGKLEERLGPYVEPVQLQVVCRRLWERLPSDDNEITPDDLSAVGDVDEALRAYYDDQVYAVAMATAVGERVVRDWFDGRLITQQGIRGQVVQGPEDAGGLKNTAVRQLVDSHLVRSEKRLGATWYELAHDRLIAPVQQSNTAWREANLTTLQRQAALWDAEGRSSCLLLRDAPLAGDEAWAQANAELLTESERDFLAAAQEARRVAEREARQQRRIRALAVGASLLSLIALVAAIVAFNAWKQASAARDAAVRSEQTAVAAENKAQEQYRLALARQLVAQSTTQARGPIDLALLLSLEANRITDTIETRGGLLNALRESPQLRQLLRGHRGPSRSVAISPDGRSAATVGDDGRLLLWDLATRQLLGEPLTGHGGPVFSVVFSPDGRYLASGGCATPVENVEECSQGETRLWDVASRQPIGTALNLHAGMVYDLAFRPGSTVLYSAGEDGQVIRWDVASSQELAPRLPGNENAAVYSLAFSGDGRLLAAGDYSNATVLWDLALTPPRSRVLAAQSDSIYAVAFNAEGTLLAAGSRDNTIKLWNVADGTERTTLYGHAAGVRDLVFVDDATLLSSSTDNRIFRWSLATGSVLGPPLTGHATQVNGIALSPAGNVLLSTSDDGSIGYWTLDARTRIGQVLGEDPQVAAVALSRDGRLLASAYCAAFDAGACGAGVIRLWDFSTGQPLEPTLAGHSNFVSTLAFSPDGTTLASSGPDGRIVIWDVARRSEITRLGNDLGAPLRGLAFSPDGTTLAGAGCGKLNAEADCAQGEIRLWDTASWQLRRPPLQAHDGSILTLAYSPDGSMLASAGRDSTIIVWDTASWTPAGPSLTGHKNSIFSLAFSPDGRLLVSGAQDAQLILWNLATRAPLIPPVPIHSDSVLSVAFSPDGQTIASAARDRRIVLFDVEARKPLLPALIDAEGIAVGVAFGADPDLLVSAIGDSVVLWNIGLESWRTTACSVAGRNLNDTEWRAHLGSEPFRKSCPQFP